MYILLYATIIFYFRVQKFVPPMVSGTNCVCPATRQQSKQRRANDIGAQTSDTTAFVVISDLFCSAYLVQK